MIIVKARTVPVTLEQGDGGGLRTTANTPPAARDAATSAIMTISVVLNSLRLKPVLGLSSQANLPYTRPTKRVLAHMVPALSLETW